VYKPVWEGVIEGYATNQISKNLWKFLWIGYEFDDLYQESWMVFDTCRNQYLEMDTPQHFMSLYKTALHNKFYDLNIKSSLDREYLEDYDLMEYYLPDRRKSIVLDLDKAPSEVRTALSLIFNAPSEILELIGFTKKNSRGFLNNKKLCSLLGLDFEIDLVDRIKTFLRNSLDSV
jgi:hypothetical protein